jgi:hypothetical protein
MCSRYASYGVCIDACVCMRSLPVGLLPRNSLPQPTPSTFYLIVVCVGWEQSTVHHGLHILVTLQRLLCRVLHHRGGKQVSECVERSAIFKAGSEDRESASNHCNKPVERGWSYSTDAVSKVLAAYLAAVSNESVDVGAREGCFGMFWHASAVHPTRT